MKPCFEHLKSITHNHNTVYSNLTSIFGAIESVSELIKSEQFAP
ncbi:hypothetical protein [Marinomonas sp. THO17]